MNKLDSISALFTIFGGMITGTLLVLSIALFVHGLFALDGSAAAIGGIGSFVFSFSFFACLYELA